MTAMIRYWLPYADSIEIWWTVFSIIAILLASRAAGRMTGVLLRLWEKNLDGALWTLAIKRWRMAFGVILRQTGFCIVGLVLMTLPSRPVDPSDPYFTTSQLVGWIFMGAQAYDVIALFLDEIDWRTVIRQAHQEPDKVIDSIQRSSREIRV